MPSRPSALSLLSRSGAAMRVPQRARGAGFTMVELIVVMILIGILGAVGASRFFLRTGFDTGAFAEQLRVMLRYGQKLAIAQNRNVYVVGSLSGAALCYANALPCPAAQIVPAPAGGNSGSTATRAFCVSGNAYAANWYCEGVPAGVTMTPVAGSMSTFYFNGLGKPYLPGDLPASGPSQASTFAGSTYNFSGDGVSISVSISPETGYVY